MCFLAEGPCDGVGVAGLAGIEGTAVAPTEVPRL